MLDAMAAHHMLEKGRSGTVPAIRNETISKVYW